MKFRLYTKNSCPYCQAAVKLLAEHQKEFECYYEDGWKDCLWHENGNKHRERHYNKDGVLNGILTKWYESGEKMSEVTKPRYLVHF